MTTSNVQYPIGEREPEPQPAGPEPPLAAVSEMEPGTDLYAEAELERRAERTEEMIRRALRQGG